MEWYHGKIGNSGAFYIAQPCGLLIALKREGAGEGWCTCEERLSRGSSILMWAYCVENFYADPKLFKIIHLHLRA